MQNGAMYATNDALLTICDYLYVQHRRNSNQQKQTKPTKHNSQLKSKHQFTCGRQYFPVIQHTVVSIFVFAKQITKQGFQVRVVRCVFKRQGEKMVEILPKLLCSVDENCRDEKGLK